MILKHFIHHRTLVLVMISNGTFWINIVHFLNRSEKKILNPMITYKLISNAIIFIRYLVSDNIIIFRYLYLLNILISFQCSFNIEQ